MFKKVLSIGLILALVLAFNIPLVRAQERDEEISALKQQVQELLKRIEKLETEQTKVTEEVKKEAEKPLLAKIAESIQPGYAKEGQIKIKGYVQGRYERHQLESTKDTFKLKSAYIIPYGTVVPGWDFEVEIDAADNTGKPLRNAFIEYTAFKPYAMVKVGQQKPSYSEEYWTSSSMIDTIERALPVTNLSAERDIGVNLLGKLFDERVEYGIGVFNGSGINTNDDNDNKDIVGRLILSPFKGHSEILNELRFGGGAWIGKQARSSSSNDINDRDRYNALLSYKYKRLKLQSEYLFQEFDQTTGSEKESDGWYIMGVFDVMQNYPLLQLVGKYEQYDPNTHSSGNRQDITTVGANYFFSKYTKIMANYRFRDEQTEIKNDEFLTQLQVKF